MSTGAYAITASGAIDRDYSISYVDGNLDVTPAPLTITADDQTNVYGDALPVLTASYVGFRQRRYLGQPHDAADATPRLPPPAMSQVILIASPQAVRSPPTTRSVM